MSLAGVLIARLRFNDLALEKLYRRQITTADVAQLRHNGGVLTRNPRPRGPGSRLFIGPTDGGRMLTVVVVRDPIDNGLWHVQTAWDSSHSERNVYDQRS